MTAAERKSRGPLLKSFGEMFDFSGAVLQAFVAQKHCQCSVQKARQAYFNPRCSLSGRAFSWAVQDSRQHPQIEM